MCHYNTAILLHTFQTYQSQIPEFIDDEKKLQQIKQQENSQQDNHIIALYEKTFPLLEQQLWKPDNHHFAQQLKNYQNLFREQEDLLQLSETSAADHKRYNFILSIPIADRPEHLKACLESIYQLCKLYAYGGTDDETGVYSKVSVVIVEDSQTQAHIDKDIELAKEYINKGLNVHHYGLYEQYELMMEIPDKRRKEISSIIGDPSIENFYHKGQAVTRNLSYLKALQLTQQNKNYTIDNVLYFFVDSDQLFQINLPELKGDTNVYGLNYFYYINRIFNENNIAILTGKLVGDPPVSPSVMAANFLDDIIVFFEQLSAQSAHRGCQFHPKSKIKPGDAAYHDMAQLFGFENHQKSYDYCCPLQEKHDHNACLKRFSKRINYFFFGEHLTRKTYFSYQGSFTQISPARTIYPGNYITNFEGLKYIIPFGKLRLRMSGPTAGRLIQSEIHQGFMSSNLPMLHTRTLDKNFQDEYRPGVEDQAGYIDLADEFERQFFGDLMLFSVVKLTKSDIAIAQYSQPLLIETFAQVEQELLELYENKHNNVNLKCEKLSSLVNNPQYWWNQSGELTTSIVQVQQFIYNIQHNFSQQSKAYQQIQSIQNRQEKIEKMIVALLTYRHDRHAWDSMLDQFIQ